MLTKGTISNLIGGMSQQATTLRLANQSADELNTYPVIVDGNTRRPPSEFVAALPSIPASAFVHPIIRDKTEKYVVTIANGALSIVDLAGNVKTVNTPDGVDYLTVPAGTESGNFAAVTVADYTFIVNRTVKTAMSSEKSPARGPEALLNVIQGNYGKVYSGTVKPVSPVGSASILGSYTAPAGSVSTDVFALDTSLIATNLVDAFTSAGMTTANGWSVTSIANCVWIQNLAGIDFSLTTSDGYSNHGMVGVKGRTQLFDNLPVTAPIGYVVGVIGDMSAPETMYYVKYTKSVASSTNTTANYAEMAGYWEECSAPDTHVSFDASTMPHVLVREADGTFTFKMATWDKRQAGDITTVPEPSFIGSALTDVTFYANRLGVFANGNIVLSRAGDFFNFWRTSAITLLDDDPIDVNAATPQVAVLRAAVPYQQSLVLWSDLNQFTFQGNELLTPKTASIKDTSQYENLSASVKPVGTTRRIFFCTDRGQWNGVREWFYDVYYHLAASDDATAHVPALIPAGTFKMSNSTIEDLLVLSTTGDLSSLFVYKYLWQDQDKLQAAWFRWSFNGATVLNHFFDNSTLYLVLNRGSKTSLEKLRLQPSLSDGGSPVTYLDRRVTADPGTYSIATDTTTYTVPYLVDPSRFKAVTTSAPRFLSLDIVGITLGASTTTIALKGDTTGRTMYFGETFETHYVFSPIYVRDGDKGQAVQEGRLQLLKVDVSYQDAGYFRVEVTPAGRSTRTYTFTGWTLGDDVPEVDSAAPLLTGVFRAPVLANADSVDIRIVNDTFLPSRFTRAEWKANFVPKSRK